VLKLDGWLNQNKTLAINIGVIDRESYVGVTVKCLHIKDP
jgi:hypothetical protein